MQAMDDFIRNELEYLPRLHDHLFCEVSGEPRFHDPDVCSRLADESKITKNLGNMARAVQGWYVDWILTGRRKSREACIQGIFTVGMWEDDDPRKAAPLLLFAVFSGRCCPAEPAIDFLNQWSQDDEVISFLVDILQNGLGDSGETIRKLCIDELRCCPAIVWLNTFQTSPFVEWFLCGKVPPSSSSSNPLLRMAYSPAQDVVDLLRKFDEACLRFRPYDLYVYDLLLGMSTAFSIRGNFGQQLKYLRQALSIAHRRHLAFGEVFPIHIFSEILRAKTNMFLKGSGKKDHVLDMAQFLMTRTGFPESRLAVAMVFSETHKTSSAIFHLGAYYRMIEDGSVSIDEQKWHDRIVDTLRKKGFDVDLLRLRRLTTTTE